MIVIPSIPPKVPEYRYDLEYASLHDWDWIVALDLAGPLGLAQRCWAGSWGAVFRIDARVRELCCGS